MGEPCVDAVDDSCAHAGTALRRVLIVFAHPSHRSYGWSLLGRVVDGLEASGHEIVVDDLYAEGFDPAMTEAEVYEQAVPPLVAAEQAKVTWADTLVFVFPVWWWGPPAVLKGWLERVLCRDFAFTYDVAVNRFAGTLGGRDAVVITTSSADPRTYTEKWQAESHVEYVGAILAASGLDVIRQLHSHEIHQWAPPAERQRALDEVAAFIDTLGARRSP